MKAIAALIALAISPAGNPAPIHDREDRDVDKIQGTWAVSSAEKAGQKAPEGDAEKATMTFSDGKFAWKAGGREAKGRFTLDAAKAPPEISIDAGDKKLTGIYKLEGDDLKICVGIGDDRPSEFATKAGSKSLLIILKRERP